MTILLCNTYAARGGAAASMGRLLQGLRGRGLDASLLVKRSVGQMPEAQGLLRGRWHSALRYHLDHLPLYRYPHRDAEMFSVGWLPDNGAARIGALQPDLVNLHWVQDGFLSVQSIGSIRAPVVWTLHDMWPFTGGCHYAGACTRYRDACGACPRLGSRREHDLSRRIWTRKQDAWQELDLTIVTPSRWLADCARASSLFRDCRIEVIPYGIDLETFRPEDKAEAKAKLGLSPQRQLLLFVASEDSSGRKGTDLLAPLMEALRQHCDPVPELAIAGSGLETAVANAQRLGRLQGADALRTAYSAADLLLCLSREDNLPNTVIEALACGTPCAAFRIGGLPDLIDDGPTGLLVDREDIATLAERLAPWLLDPARLASASRAARASAEERYGLDRQASRYAVLFEELLAQRKARVADQRQGD